MGERKQRNFRTGGWPAAFNVSLVEEIEWKRKVNVKGSEVGRQQEDEAVDQGDSCGQL